MSWYENDMRMKKFVTVIFIAFVVLAFPKSLFAFGITPAEINIDNIKPGGRYETLIYVTRPAVEANEELDVVLETDLGEMEDWIRFTPGKVFPFPMGKNTTTFRIRIDVPQDVEIKTFQGRITAKGQSAKKAREGVTIVKGAVLGINVETTNFDNVNLKVLSIKAPEVNSGDPVRLLLNIENMGNIAASPDRVNMEVMDLFEKPIESLSTTTLEKIDPFTTKEIQASFNSELEVGQYRIDAIVLLRGEEIAREKMVLTVNAKPAGIEEKGTVGMSTVPVYDHVIFGFALAFIGLILLMLLLVLLLKKKNEGGPVFEKKLSKMVKENKVISLVLIGLSLVIVLTGISLTLTNKPVVSVDTSQNRENVDEDQEVEPLLPTTEESVMGAKAENTEVEPFVVSRPQTPGKYPVYQNSDFNSAIVYEADTGETFEVTAEKDGWFQVVLENGTLGWLHETSIKEIN
jgi:hypothetical protein